MTTDFIKPVSFSLITPDDIPGSGEEKKERIKMVQKKKLDQLMTAIERSSITLAECCEKAGLNYNSVKTQKSLGTIGWTAIDNLSDAFFEIATERLNALKNTMSDFLDSNSAIMKDLVSQVDQELTKKKIHLSTMVSK